MFYDNKGQEIPYLIQNLDSVLQHYKNFMFRERD